MGTNLVQYGKYELETAEQEEAAIPSFGVDRMKLIPGKNLVRFLPPPVGKSSPFRVAHTHFLNSSAGRVSFTCPRMEAKKRCPACDKYDQLSRSGSPVDRKAADEYKPKMQVFANVIDRRNPESGPKVLQFGIGIQRDLIAIRKDEDIGGDYTDPEKGFDILIERTGTGKDDTKYKVFPTKTQKPLGNPDWIAAQHDLEKFARVRGPEEIEKMLAGVGDSSEDEGSTKASRPKPKRTADDDVTDTEDDDVDV